MSVYSTTKQILTSLRRFIFWRGCLLFDVGEDILRTGPIASPPWYLSDIWSLLFGSRRYNCWPSHTHTETQPCVCVYPLPPLDNTGTKCLFPLKQLKTPTVCFIWVLTNSWSRHGLHLCQTELKQHFKTNNYALLRLLSHILSVSPCDPVHIGLFSK